MAKPKRPFPGMRGTYVLALLYEYDPPVWIAHMGANDLAKLRAERRRLPQWSDSKVHIFNNDIGDPSPKEQLT